MEHKERNKNIPVELDDDALDHVSGGTEDDGWYWGFGYPPDYLNACPKCGGGVYFIKAPLDHEDIYMCGPCGWEGHSIYELTPGYQYNA